MNEALSAEIGIILSVEAGVCPSTSAASLEALGIRWPAIILAMYALEQRYGVDLPIAEHRIGDEFRTIDDLTHYAAALIQAAPAAHSTQ